MQDFINSKPKDEIVLRDLFITLWAYKLLIFSLCALGITYGGYYTLNAEKTYTSVAIFKIDQASTSRMSFDGQIGTLARLAGIQKNNLGGSLPIDKIMGRIFIENIDKKLNFQTDPYFNTYNPKSVDPIWKSFIKSAIGWQKSNIDDKQAIWSSIVTKYSKNIELKETKEGSFKISVTHKDPHRAAEIANTIMETVITDQKSSMDKEQNQLLSYLSSTLASALSDLEVSQSNLKEFSLKNNYLPLESFAAGSLKLDALREQLSRTSELHEAVAALSIMLKNKTTDQNNYLTLRQKFPIIDQVAFRRILGQNEIISSWNWPEASSVNAVLDTLLERKSRLQSQINTSQINAERSGLALEIYNKLERKAKIAEATYTVLIEQVKAQTMAAGYRSEKSEVYEYASISQSPSAPNRNLILALGAILGLFAGTLLSLFLALFRGVCYSKEALRTGAQARLMDSVRTILPLRNKSLKVINTLLVKKSYPVLRNMAVEIYNSGTTQVVVTSTRAKLTANELARTLASYMQSDTMKVAVIDFSSRANKLDIDKESLSIGSFIVTESVGNVSVLKPDGDLATVDLLSQRSFTKKMQSLNSTIDILFLCADDEDANSLLRAIRGQKAFHVTLARTKYTKFSNLMQLNSLFPIQGLLHE